MVRDLQPYESLGFPVALLPGDAMRIFIALVLGVLGLWFFVHAFTAFTPALLRIIGFIAAIPLLIGLAYVLWELIEVPLIAMLAFFSSRSRHK